MLIVVYFFCRLSIYIDSIHRVKSEQDKNDDEGDVTDDERKAHHNMLRHHAVMPHQSYYQHPMFSHHFKQELDPKNQTESDCGVSIPASKPKIWSLADTAACKTPPPLMNHHHHHLQEQSYNNMNNDQWTTNNTVNNYPTNYHQLNHSVQHLDHQSLQLHQHHLHNSSHPVVGDNPMQMMTNFVQSAQNSTSNMSMESDMSITPSSEDIQVESMNGNHNNPMYSRYGGMTTHQHYHSPLGINSTEISMTARQAQISSIQKHHTGTNQTMGFPEIQTDTPPQTPPNMKLPIAALTPTTGICFNNNNNNNNGNSHNIVNSQSPNIINNKSPLKNGGESTYVENFHISTSNTTAISRSTAVDSLQKKQQHHIHHEYNNNNNQQMVTENNNDMNTSDNITRNELTANGFKSFYKK